MLKKKLIIFQITFNIMIYSYKLKGEKCFQLFQYFLKKNNNDSISIISIKSNFIKRQLNFNKKTK